MTKQKPDPGESHEQCSCKAPVPCMGHKCLGLAAALARRFRSDSRFLDSTSGSRPNHMSEARSRCNHAAIEMRDLALVSNSWRKWWCGGLPTPQTGLHLVRESRSDRSSLPSRLQPWPAPVSDGPNSTTRCLDGGSDCRLEVVCCLSHLTKALVHEPPPNSSTVTPAHSGLEVRRLSLLFAVACMMEGASYPSQSPAPERGHS
jgi:hypothetical protein